MIHASVSGTKQVKQPVDTSKFISSCMTLVLSFTFVEEKYILKSNYESICAIIIR